MNAKWIVFLALPLMSCTGWSADSLSQRSTSAAASLDDACAAISNPPEPPDEDDDAGVGDGGDGGPGHPASAHGSSSHGTSGSSGGHHGHGGGDASLLTRLASQNSRVRRDAALRVLRHAPDFADPILSAAVTVVGDEAEWRADPALVRILRNSFPSSPRHFPTAVRANAALALGLIAQVHRGDHFRGGENDGNHDDQVGEGGDLGFSHLPLPDYVFRAVEKAACPPEDPSVREGAARALGQFRDSRAHDLLTAIAASPMTGDDVQDRLLTLSSQRALTMIEPQNSVSPQSIVEAQRGLGALKQALGGGQP